MKRAFLKCLIVIGLILLEFFLVYAQPANTPRRLDARKPSVYLTVEGRVRSFEQCSRCEQDSFRLRLTNNMPTAINVDARYGAEEPVIKLKGDGAKSYVGLPRGSVVGLCYQVESMGYFTSRIENGSVYSEIPADVPIPKIEFACSCNSQVSSERRFNAKGLWIPSGSYIMFDIPRKFLSPGLKIYTLFNYEWESKEDGVGNNEPHHQVFFYSSDLPNF